MPFIAGFVLTIIIIAWLIIHNLGFILLTLGGVLLGIILLGLFFYLVYRIFSL